MPLQATSGTSANVQHLRGVCEKNTLPSFFRVRPNEDSCINCRNPGQFLTCPYALPPVEADYYLNIVYRSPVVSETERNSRRLLNPSCLVAQGQRTGPEGVEAQVAILRESSGAGDVLQRHGRRGRRGPLHTIRVPSLTANPPNASRCSVADAETRYFELLWGVASARRDLSRYNGDDEATWAVFACSRT